jgi:hypothetical protein
MNVMSEQAIWLDLEKCDLGVMHGLSHSPVALTGKKRGNHQPGLGRIA